MEIQSVNLNLIYHSTFYHQLWEAFKRTIYPEAHFTGLRSVCQLFCLRIFSILLSTLTYLLSQISAKRKFGGDDRDRTCDVLVANQVLSQLSYIPT